MATYNSLAASNFPAADTLYQNEVYMYGSSRLGSITLNRNMQRTTQVGDQLVNMLANFPAGQQWFKTFYVRGKKQYEMSNHLGNVLVTVSDKKIPVLTAVGSSNILYYNADVVTATDYYPFGMAENGRKFTQTSSSYRYGFNGQEKSDDVTSGNYTAEYWEYDSRTGIRWNLDPESRDGISDYSTFDGNPIENNDPDGDCPNCATAAIGAFFGGIIGGAIEAGTQLYKNGKVSNWKAVGGAAVQGAITGGAAGFTGGASLLVSGATKVAVVGASAVVANVAGGTASRAIQGKKTTGKDVAVDAAAGALGAGLGAVAGKFVKGSLDKLSKSAKGKLGEAVTKVKYAAKGYVDKGKAVVATGGKTPTGKVEVAKYDYSFQQLFTGNRLTVESKFNTSGFTTNQSKALIYVTTPGGVIVDRTTSQQFGNVTNAATQSATTGASNQIKHK